MHMTIGAIVYASTAGGARSRAGSVFEGLVGEDEPFDYYTVLADETRRANSRKGRSNIDSLMAVTKEHFMANIERLRKALSQMSNEEAFSAAGEFSVKYQAYDLGKSAGSGVHLYTLNSIGITTAEMLEEILTKRHGPKGVLDWRPQEIDDDVWIVLADVHS